MQAVSQIKEEDTKELKKQHDEIISSNIKQELLNWLSYTQFHGAKRLANRECGLFWIPSMVLLFNFTIILLYLNIQRYQEQPTFIARVDSYITEQPFPAVIICPEIRFHSDKKIKFLANLKYPAGLNRSYIWQVLPQLSAFTSPDVSFKLEDLENVEKLLNFNNINVENATTQLTTSCEEALLRCRWKDRLVNCSKLFRMELTGDGLCCVFNGRSLRREMKEKGQEHIEKPVTRHRTPMYRIGYNSGLMVAVNQSQKHYTVDLSYKWMALQPGQRFVDVSVNGTALNPTYEQWLKYHMYNIQIADAAKELSTQLRRCNMETTPLKYFPVYRQKHCILECEMAKTIKLCNCVRTVHPRPRGVLYCNAARVQCARHAMVSKSNLVYCLCDPTCAVDSSYTTTSSFILSNTSKTVDNFYEGLSYDKITIIRAYVARYIDSRKRHSYYTYLDLFSQLGGMFNIVFGCSILTILGFFQLILKNAVILWRRLIQRRAEKKNRK